MRLKLRDEKGVLDLPTLLILFPIIMFIIFFPIGVNSYYYKVNTLNNAADVAIQLMEVKGGFDNEVLNAINTTLQNAELDTSKLTYSVTPAQANNVTSSSFLPRGQIMTITLYYPGDNLLNYITGLIGLKVMPDSWHYKVSKTGMSQKYQ